MGTIVSPHKVLLICCFEKYPTWPGSGWRDPGSNTEFGLGFRALGFRGYMGIMEKWKLRYYNSGIYWG